MPDARGIAVEVFTLVLQVIGVATLSSAIIVYTWDSTRSAVRTLAVAIMCVVVLRMAYARYRVRRARRRRDRYMLPYVRYEGGTDI